VYKTDKVLSEHEAVVNNRKVKVAAVTQRREKSGSEEESEQVWSAPFVMVKIEVGNRVLFWHPSVAEKVYELMDGVIEEAMGAKQEMDKEFEERRKNRKTKRKNRVMSPGKTERQREKEKNGGKTYQQRKSEKSAESRKIRNDMRSGKGK